MKFRFVVQTFVILLFVSFPARANTSRPLFLKTAVLMSGAGLRRPVYLTPFFNQSSQRCGEERASFPQRHAHFVVLRLPTQVIEARGTSAPFIRTAVFKRAGGKYLRERGSSTNSRMTNVCTTNLNFHIQLPGYRFSAAPGAFDCLSFLHR